MSSIGRHTPLDWVETSFLVDGRAWYTYTTQDPVDGAFLEVAVRQANPLRHGQCDWAWTCRVDGYVFSYGTHHGRDDRAINVARYAMKEVVIARVQSRKWKAFQTISSADPAVASPRTGHVGVIEHKTGSHESGSGTPLNGSNGTESASVRDETARDVAPAEKGDKAGVGRESANPSCVAEETGTDGRRCSASWTTVRRGVQTAHSSSHPGTAEACGKGAPDSGAPSGVAGACCRQDASSGFGWGVAALGEARCQDGNGHLRDSRRDGAFTK